MDWLVKSKAWSAQSRPSFAAIRGANSICEAGQYLASSLLRCYALPQSSLTRAHRSPTDSDSGSQQQLVQPCRWAWAPSHAPSAIVHDVGCMLGGVCCPATRFPKTAATSERPGGVEVQWLAAASIILEHCLLFALLKPPPCPAHPAQVSPHLEAQLSQQTPLQPHLSTHGSTAYYSSSAKVRSDIP
jgi:hypothetical protein